MASRDANKATWYVLRYAEDFAGGGDDHAPFYYPSVPFIEPSLSFDALRGVLELRPEAAVDAADPPPGLALDIEGTVYRVDDDGVLTVVRCDGSRMPLLCEPGILLRPQGLALDRRGFLYIADPAACRVVVLTPDDGHVQAILGGGGPGGALAEPVDAAVAPDGRVYVADRKGGRIAVFTAGKRPVASFATAAADDQRPMPIAVMIAADGNLLVADAWLPRLLSYAPDGIRLADVDLGSLVAPLAGSDLALGAFHRAYGEKPPRFIVGACGPCGTPANDGGARLAEVHRALRLLALNLGRRYAGRGVFISRSLDGGRPGVAWHRIEVEFDTAPPPGSRMLIETYTDDTATPAKPRWIGVAKPDGALLPFSFDVPEQLVQSPPGRYLWLKLSLQSDDGLGTPSVRAVRAYYPRNSYLDLLPTAYRRDPEAALFMEHFLALFEHVYTGVEDRYEAFSRELNPDAAPQEVIDWLAALVDLAFDPSWPLVRRRALVAEAMALYRSRGTVAGLEHYVEIYTGIRPLILEAWLERPTKPAFLGRPGNVLGCAPPLPGCTKAQPQLPDADLWARYAHRFTVYVYLDERCDAELMLKVVDRIIEANKPAHTAHQLEAIYPAARVGLQSRVGLDLVLGAASAPGTRLGAPAGGVLGHDSVLGAKRPGYVRRWDG